MDEVTTIHWHGGDVPADDDGGYLASPVVLEQLALTPGDRAEIIVNIGAESAALVDSAFGRVLAINGEPPPPEESGWEDSVWVNSEREVVIAARFNTYPTEGTPYLFHCHILDHEDLDMMGQYLIVE